MNNRGGQTPPAFMPLGEALQYAERCRSDGRLTEAEAVCRQILQVQPNTPEVEHLLGVIAHQNGKLAEAIQHVQRATRLAPQIAVFHANLGEMLRLAGRPKLAVEEARRALAIEPDLPAALSNLGVALYELKDYEEAARAQRKAIAAAPDFAEAHGNLGNALHALRKFDEAIAAFRRAVELKPDYADGWANYGTTLHHSGSFDEGIAALRRAIALAPHHANARSGLGILLLMRGEFGEGLDEYEWRLRSTERKGPRFPEIPWAGGSLAGKHIYVQAEQGFGDTLQFARYIPPLARRASRVTLRVHQQLVTLFRESLPGITVLGDRGDPAPYHCDAVLLSLPRLFRTRLESIPSDVRYLRAPADAAQRWGKHLAKMRGLKVGLVWAGNPEHVNDSRRSLDLKVLAALFEVQGASFASLQFGPRTADLKKRKGKPAIEDLGARFEDFADTAGAVDALDLVITVDTSVAHLAGALGKPVWVLLPWVSDWRWMLNREDNPWYPTMRLFRQKRGESWTDIVPRIVKELAAVVQGDLARLTPFKAEGVRRAAHAAAIMAAEAAQVAEPITAPVTAMPPGQALIVAEQKRRNGFLADADELTRRAIEAEPDNAEAAHMLGIIAHQSGKLSDAIAHVRQAIAINPNVALYHANLGEMCRLAGRADEAIAASRRAIALDPGNAGAHSNLGIALFDQGKFEEALSLHERAIALQAHFVQAHSNRGNALQRLKRFAEAEPSYRRAVELQPDFADGWNNLGTCLRELKRAEEAETVYRKALEIAPNNPDTLDNLALAVKDLERLDEAAELLRRALVIEQNSDKIHLHYGTVLLDQKKVDEAEVAASRALSLNMNSHDAVNLMGRIAFERGDLDGALASHQRALALKPDLADAYNNMGNVLKELGRLDEAENAYLEALRLDPAVASVYVNLADSRKFVAGDPHLVAMEALAAKSERLSKTDRMQIDFALGKAYADLQDYPRSFRHLHAGNAAKRATIGYDETAAFALFDHIERIFTPDMIEAKSGSGDPSQVPIFVVGMPRSGTTLIEQIIASHPMVHGAGELQTLHDVVLTVRGTDGCTIPYPEFVPALDEAALRQIGRDYVARLGEVARREASPTVQRVTDKMPSNYYFLGLIHLALPQAKIIHAVRDPVDTCVSCFSKLFSAEQNHTYDLGELGRYYRRYERLMTHWCRVLPAGSVLDVRYEDVVGDLQSQAQRIIAHCGLPWDDRCLSFHRTERPVRTASATQVRKPIYRSAVGRWRVYEDQLEPLLTALGGRARLG
ncbi:tetratricopeptide repeat protein [Bradyrhizobium uaiense]|uniref:Tetratricopeptide repeat protein n=1 Tax=Bradyrhizobium uaiense TaxID=2594946 RepID=A0A6P1BD89_9BRAD|nr:tetratricopeptide repeat protein [Bradyrhizobium uaiense]NEU96124.1 tetratricopeptide repeat protein [Bradyrhizobium uaiense]